MLAVIESIILIDWINQSKLVMMIPGFEPMDLNPVNIIFETEDKLDEIFGSVAEWVQI